MKPQHHVDATGLLCPQPLALLKQALDSLQSGESVTISVTDPHAELDFEIWCERMSHGLEKNMNQADVMVFTVTKGKAVQADKQSLP